jgi:hypothetical protein
MGAIELQDGKAMVSGTANDGTAVPVSLRVLRSVSEIEEVRDAWMQMQWHPNADIDFYLTILRSRAEILRPHVIVLYRDRLPATILVGRVEDQRVDFKVGYARAFGLRARQMTFIYGGLLGDSSYENCRVMVREIIGSLRVGEADVAVLYNIRCDSPIYRAALELPGFLWRDHAPTPEMHWALRLPNAVEDAFRGMSSKTLGRRRQEAHKLLRDHSGNVRVTCFSTPAQLERVVRDAEEVAKRTYHRGLGVGFIDSTESRRRLLLAAQKGWLRAYVLYVADCPAGFWIGSLYRGILHGDFTAYDPDLSKYSPGAFLLMRIIEESCRNSVTEIDFGFGDAWYKGVFCNRQWQEASVSIFAPHLRGIALKVFRLPAVVIDQTAKRLLARAKLLEKVKRVWRNRLRKEDTHVLR